MSAQSTTTPVSRNPAAELVRQMWSSSAPLTAVGLFMLALAVPSAIGIVVDDRVITGAPAWLKPFKFAISTAIYSLTLAWVFRWLTDWPRVRRVVGWTTAIVFALEVAIIDLQAWRGTTSHFNTATPLDRTLFALMGIAIMIQTSTSVAVAVALWRQRFASRAMGQALRFGMTLTILGAMTGPLMTRPTSQQMVDVRAGKGMPTVGAHTVGGPDGGPGMPVTGWSTEHGDVRVPHFVGLHALQVLALVAVAVGALTQSERTRVRLVTVSAASYTALFGLLLWGALRGQSVVDPDATMLFSLTVWATATAVALGAAIGWRREAGTNFHQIAA